MSALDRIRQAFPELANASDSEVLGEASRRTGMSASQIADTLGIAPRGTTAEIGRQLGAGFAVDLPRMAGQALKYFGDAGGERVDEGAFPRLGRPTGLERQYGVQISEPAPAYRAGQALVESAERRAPEWEPDMRGRGLVGEALVTGARAVGPMVPAVAAMFLPGGQPVGLSMQAALFGGSAAQDTYEKLIVQGVPEAEAAAAARRTGGLQGLGETAATAALGPLFRPAMAAVRGAPTAAGVARAATDTGIIRPLARGMALNVPLQAGTEVAQDVGTELIERAYGARPEDIGEIARQSALGGAGLSLLLGPLAAGGQVARSRRAAALKEALYGDNTPIEVRAQAMDLVAAEARRQGVAEQDIGTWMDEQFAAEDARTEALRTAEAEQRNAAINLLGEQAQGLEGLRQPTFGSLEQQRAFEEGLAGVQVDTPFASLDQQRAFEQGLQAASLANIERTGQQYQDLMGGRASTLMQAQDLGQQAQEIMAPQQRGLEAAQRAGEQWQEVRAGKTRLQMEIEDIGREWQKRAAEIPQPVTGELTRGQRAALRGPEGRRLRPTSTPITPVEGGPMATTLLQPPQAAPSSPLSTPAAAPSSLLTERPAEAAPVVSPPSGAPAVPTPAAPAAAGGSLRGRRGPVKAGDTVRVNDTDVTLSEEQATAWNAAQEAYDGKARRARAITNYQERESQLRAAGMQLSAERRKITGALTGKERAAQPAEEVEADEAQTAQAQKVIDDLGLRPLAEGGQKNLQASVTGGNIAVSGKASFGAKVLASATNAFIRGRRESESQAGKLAAAARKFGATYLKYLNAAGNLTPSESRATLKPTKKYPMKGDAAQADARAGTDVENVRKLLRDAQAALSELGQAAGNNAKNVEALIRLSKDAINARKVELDRELESDDIDAIEGASAEMRELVKLDLGLSQGWAAAKRGVFRTDATMLDVRGGEVRTSREEQQQGFEQPLVRAATYGAAVGPRAKQETGFQGVLNYIRSSGTPFERMIAKAVTEVFRNTKNPPTLVFAEGNPGYNPANNTITMSPTASPEVALHEALHAALQWYVHSNPKNPLVQNLLKAVDKVVKYDTNKLSEKAAAVQKVLADLKKGRRDLDAVLELVSYGNTLAEFRKALEAMPTKGTPTSFVQGAKDVWNMILATVRRMLNVPQSVASDVIMDSFKLLEEASRAQYTPVTGKPLEAAVQSNPTPAQRAQTVQAALAQTRDEQSQEAGYSNFTTYKDRPSSSFNITRTLFEQVGFGKDGKVSQALQTAAAKSADVIRKEFPALDFVILNLNSRFGQSPTYKRIADFFKQDAQTGLLEAEYMAQYLYRNPQDAERVIRYMDGDKAALTEEGRDATLRRMADNLDRHIKEYISTLPAKDQKLFQDMKFSDYALSPNSIAQLAGKSLGIRELSKKLGTERRTETSIDAFKQFLTFKNGVLDTDVPMYQLFETIPDGQGKMIRVPFGFISKDQAAANQGLDMDRSRVWFMQRATKADGDGPFVFVTRATSSTNLRDISGKLARGEYTPAEREEAVQQVSAALLNTMAALSHNYAATNFFRGLAEMERNADGSPTARSIAFDSLEQINATFPDRQITEANILSAPSDEAKTYELRAAAQRSGTWVKLPDRDTYGALKGKIIPGTVWNNMLDMNDRSPLLNSQVLSDLMTTFKKSKTVLTPATHVNNILTNYALMLLHGIPHKSLQGAAQLMYKYEVSPKSLSKDELRMMQEFYRSGAVLGQFTNTEAKNFITRKLAENIKPENDKSLLMKLAAWANFEKETEQYMARAARGAKLTDNFFTEVYAAGDNVFRLAAFLNTAGNIQAAAGGGKLTDAQIREAGLVARKLFLDYDIDARWVRAARQSFLPFVSWAYAITPVLGRLAIEKPWTMVNMMAALGIMAAMTDGDDDWRDKGPEQVREKFLGIVPSYYRIPFMGTDESPVYYNLGKSIPFISLFQPPMGQTKLFGQEWVPSALTPGGPYTALIASTLFGIDAFTGKPLADATETQTGKFLKAAESVYNTMAPSVASTKLWGPEDGDIAKLLQNRKGPTGVEPDALFLARTFGFSAYEFNRSEVQFWQDSQVKKIKREFETVMNKAKREEYAKGYPDYEALDAELADLRTRLEERIAEIRGED
jgi:hypothetical protein